MKREKTADRTHPYIQELIRQGKHLTQVCTRKGCFSMSGGGTPLVNDPVNGWKCPNCGTEYHVILRKEKE